MKRIIALASVAFLVAALAVGLWAAFGRGGSTPLEPDPAAAGSIHMTLADVKRFDEYPVYYLGEKYQGLPLVQVIRMDWPGSFPDDPKLNRPDHEVIFIYGDCEIPPGEEGCPVPLSVSVRPKSEVPYEQVPEEAKVGPPECVRGAKVQQLKSGTKQLWTDDVTVGITGNGADLGQTVMDLVRANGSKPDVPGKSFDKPQRDCVGR